VHKEVSTRPVKNNHQASLNLTRVDSACLASPFLVTCSWYYNWIHNVNYPTQSSRFNPRSMVDTMHLTTLCSWFVEYCKVNGQAPWEADYEVQDWIILLCTHDKNNAHDKWTETVLHSKVNSDTFTWKNKEHTVNSFGVDSDNHTGRTWGAFPPSFVTVSSFPLTDTRWPSNTTPSSVSPLAVLSPSSEDLVQQTEQLPIRH